MDIEPKKKSFKEVEELSVTTDDKQAKLKIQLLEYFNHKKPYLNPELSLKEVAQALQTNHYALSRFINKEFEVNFYTLINRFRVEYILHLIELNKGTINCDTLHAISGFKSRTTFFKQFKEIAGCTPQEYIESRKTEKSDNSTIKTKLF
ncbi:helix-turn-helix domain-containing protein [Bacteroides ovatus]|uniref:helix-turn-helix domain-containing protein n=1 Tax=Bacteroides ovatus TaxID=28116 RepID=UPI0022E8E5EE|nr:AraC family transcriptional regulator [Bacteroides ovatus]